MRPLQSTRKSFCLSHCYSENRTGFNYLLNYYITLMPVFCRKPPSWQCFLYRLNGRGFPSLQAVAHYGKIVQTFQFKRCILHATCSWSKQEHNGVLINITCYFINKLHKKYNRAAVSKYSYVLSSKEDILNHVLAPDMRIITCWKNKCTGVSETFYYLNLLFGKTHTWKVQCVVKLCSGKR